MLTPEQAKAVARTAGFTDPLRLQWAIADGPVEAAVGDVKVALSIDEEGEP